jgi:hypothetical protein
MKRGTWTEEWLVVVVDDTTVQNDVSNTSSFLCSLHDYDLGISTTTTNIKLQASLLPPVAIKMIKVGSVLLLSH